MTVNHRKISDVILLEDIKSWNVGDVVSISAGTGSGKSYFIENKLYPIAEYEKKKILYLVNRKRLQTQIQQRIERENKTDYIDVVTYQKLQNDFLYKDLERFNDTYKYIVCDECHYFFTDATFNYTTDISLDWIVGRSECVRIFMSATSTYILDYLEHGLDLHVKKYEEECQYNYIKKLIFYEKDAVIEKKLAQIKKNEKALYFSSSAQKAYELHLKFPDSLFVCSESNKEYKKHLRMDLIEEMLRNEKFNEKYLFTTHTLDNGVNIIDRDVKYVVVDMDDLDIIIQCIGRRRIIDNKDKITVIVKIPSNSYLGGKMVQINKAIERADYLSFNGTNEFIKKYPRQYSGNMIYDSIDKNGNSIKVVNKLMIKKYRNDLSMYTKFMNVDGKFKKSVCQLLKRSEYSMLEQEMDSATLNDFLKKYTGRKMFGDEQQVFKEFLKINVFNSPRFINGSLGLNTINGFFKDNDYGYIVESKRETSGDKRNKTYWILGKITY